MRQLVHCSYHKCLTLFFKRVLTALYGETSDTRRGYRHFNSLVGDFYREAANHRVASINNHAVDRSQLERDCRITRFVRDPRDLVVSGYHYHRRGAEAWCHVVGPSPEDWRVVNGCIPDAMPRDQSFASYLQSVSLEDGLIAEIDFRRRHFDSMLEWDTADPRVKLFRYEDVIGREWIVFGQVLAFYGVPWRERVRGAMYGQRFSARRQKNGTRHIRNPSIGQWHQVFTGRVSDYFEERHGRLLDLYGYR